MDVFEGGEVFEHLSFLQLFFQANETNATTHDRKVVVEKRGFVKRFWSNATFSFLLDKFEERIWEFK